MSEDQVKEVLLRYRPGGRPGAEDPELTEALSRCEADARLRGWFQDHCRVQIAIRDSFRQITPPAGLKEQIISEYQASRRAARWRQPAVLASIAMVLIVAAGILVWQRRGPGGPDEMSLAAFQTRMVGKALRPYGMDVSTNDLTAVRSYLAQQKCPADFALPSGLKEAKVTGCAITKWQDANVSMICFLKKSGKAAPGNGDLWLFVMDESAVRMNHIPSPNQKILQTISRLKTATWIEGGKLYMLGTEGDEAELRKWL